ncbi:hypothetical protein D7S89_15110 [Trinickia fusca]|uniref:Uncharacterized protein n=1 Tax=Trinickia fusca TaxID=2419777 RepID=A0A494XHH8_9BURK|nr:hypothetical protein D7S89_15110 [Trinickia fusca]
MITAAVASYEKPEDRAVMGAQWEQIPLNKILKDNPSLEKKFDRVGFHGQVNVNMNTGEIIIADRGTANAKNLYTDAQLALHLSTNAQPLADEFARLSLKAAEEKLATRGVKPSAVYVTGHSLGGYESQGQTVMLSTAKDEAGKPLLPADVKLVNLSIDAPGIARLADKGDSSRYSSYNLSAQADGVHLAGGSHLKGTQEFTVPVGPTVASTAGLVGAGVAVTVATDGAGASAGAGLIKKGVQNELQAHSSKMVMDFVNKTALSDQIVVDLGRVPKDQVQAMMKQPRVQAPEPVAPACVAPAAAAPAAAQAQAQPHASVVTNATAHEAAATKHEASHTATEQHKAAGAHESARTHAAEHEEHHHHQQHHHHGHAHQHEHEQAHSQEQAHEHGHGDSDHEAHHHEADHEQHQHDGHNVYGFDGNGSMSPDLAGGGDAQHSAYVERWLEDRGYEPRARVAPKMA